MLLFASIVLQSLRKFAKIRVLLLLMISPSFFSCTMCALYIELGKVKVVVVIAATLKSSFCYYYTLQALFEFPLLTSFAEWLSSDLIHLKLSLLVVLSNQLNLQAFMLFLLQKLYQTQTDFPC